MKLLGSLATLLALAAVANAGIIVEDHMRLTYYPSGDASIENIKPGGVNLDFDTYEIWHKPPGTDPKKMDTVGWNSLADQYAAALDELINNANNVPILALQAAFGAGISGFAELAANDGLLAEGNLAGFASFVTATSWAIGKPFTNTVPPVGEIEFFYTKPGVVGDKFTGEVVFIPEPATLLLLAMGGLLALRRRRR